MTDRIHLYRNSDGWHWRRETCTGTVIARSTNAHPRQRRCLIDAVLANRRPYRLHLDGGIEPDFETDSPTWRSHFP